MRIVDAFIFFNELDVLKMRLSLLYDVVDFFYIAEADHTFSGTRKPFYFEDNINMFQEWADKIIYAKVLINTFGLDFSEKDSSYNPLSASWKIEAQQRNSLINAISTLNENDLVLISDLDEFIDPVFLKEMSNNFPYIGSRLELRNHFLFMNCLNFKPDARLWRHPFLARCKLLREHNDINKIRINGIFPAVLKDAGWHFSYLGGADQISLKIKSFSHSEYNREEITNISSIRSKINLGRGLLEEYDDNQYAFAPLSWYPTYLQRIMRNYPQFIVDNLLDFKF
ncbi:hypothetical protein KIH24_13380 [Rhizobiales bacterium TNE-4]|nr:hypothetical protein [Rhizobiales bacterium TNE-4]MBV1828610.1 hypothetical protein [Rhizobiales bacterium TNE-4]